MSVRGDVEAPAATPYGSDEAPPAEQQQQQQQIEEAGGVPRTPGGRRGRRLLRLLNVSDPGVLFYAALLVNVPQIVVVGLVFGLKWEADENVCDPAARARWRVWGAAHAARLGATTVIAGLRWRFASNDENTRGTRRRAAAVVANARNSLDALALIWFVVGNMWLLGGSDAECSDATKSPIYVVDVAMLVVQYAQICLPCVFAIAMVPVFCFCLPCVIRLLAALHEPNNGRGASRRAISELPTVSYAHGLELGGEDPCCSVCISDFEIGDNLRVLPCKHAFHARCVDQWLTVNANCPLCRKSIFSDDDDRRATNNRRPPPIVRGGAVELETATPLTATTV
ncbi:hypothetical protein CTAYLR_006560 [Chrysophaeum taylorii]|uniref:RING-type domain-containing protein n=1 Tax=Chrysophaeum taylorii TaxID=2483200 RepID=A0AAD7UHB5_9STRA|nr:hypothetical protein CTAYLR_006560 [Chrysophaeum taylorii]